MTNDTTPETTSETVDPAQYGAHPYPDMRPRYAALDAVVAEIVDALDGEEPLWTDYETGGHVAVAVWIIQGHSLVSVILGESLEDCEFQYSPLAFSTGELSLSDLRRNIALAEVADNADRKVYLAQRAAHKN